MRCIKCGGEIDIKTWMTPHGLSVVAAVCKGCPSVWVATKWVEVDITKQMSRKDKRNDYISKVFCEGCNCWYDKTIQSSHTCYDGKVIQH